MPMQWTWKKMINGALAVALLTGGAAAAVAVPQTASAEDAVQERPFTDVRAGHWAEKHITKLELQGIINGYEKPDKSKEFRPNSSVTQQEAVVMAIRFAGLSNLVGQASVASEPVDWVVPSVSYIRVNAFAEDYVELAFEKGLLDREQENELAAADIAADAGAHWGSKPASREWVTKLIVKAINQDAVASQLQYEESQFFDAGNIDSKYKGYVNAAVQLGLVTGVTPNTFEPKSPVNRASLATLFSRAQVQFPVGYPNQVTGIVTGLTDNSIKVYAGGVEYTYELNAGTSFFHYGSELLASKDQLIEYGDVTVIEASGTAKYVEVLSDKVHTETAVVTFDRLHSTEQSFYAWLNIDEMIQIAFDGNVVVEDTDGNALFLSQLKRDSVITIVRDSFRANPKVIKIVVSANPVVTTVKGKLQNIDSKLITVSAESGYVTKDMAVGAEVVVAGLSNASIDDLIKSEDEVELTLNDSNQVIQVKVLNRDVQVIAGAKLVYYEEKSSLITLLDYNQKPYALKFNDRTVFDYMGTAIDKKAAMTLIAQNANIVVSYTHDQVVSLKFIIAYTGTVTDIDTKGKILTIKANEGYEVKLPYSNTAISVKDKAAATHLDLRIGDKVTLSLKMDQIEVVGINVHKAIQYEVVTVDSVNKKLRLKNAATTAFDLTVGETKVVREDGTNGFLSTLKPGSKVNLHYIGLSLEKVELVQAASNG